MQSPNSTFRSLAQHHILMSGQHTALLPMRVRARFFITTLPGDHLSTGWVVTIAKRDDGRHFTSVERARRSPIVGRSAESRAKYAKRNLPSPLEDVEDRSSKKLDAYYAAQRAFYAGRTVPSGV